MGALTATRRLTLAVMGLSDAFRATRPGGPSAGAGAPVEPPVRRATPRPLAATITPTPARPRPAVPLVEQLVTDARNQRLGPFWKEARKALGLAPS